MNLKTNKVIFGTACDADPRRSIEQHGHAMRTLKASGIGFREVRIQQAGEVIDGLLLEATDVRDHERNLSVGMEFARMFKRGRVFEAHNDDTCVVYDLRQGVNPVWRGSVSLSQFRMRGVPDDAVWVTCPYTGRALIVDLKGSLGDT